jgi:hypothetical protein
MQRGPLMSHETSHEKSHERSHARGYVLAETRLEERDGATWVSGLCPFCWERVAFLAVPRGMSVTMLCPRGLHPLRVEDETSEGSRSGRPRAPRPRAPRMG